MNNAVRGRKGEEQAANALEASGMKIVAKNFRSKYGEVDIVATSGDTIVFVEVKAWSTYGIENLQYGLDIRKQRKIINTAKFFLSENREYSRMAIRFDVIYVNKNSITHLASAFMEGV